MKILVLAHMIPYPPNTGALQRNYNLFKNLAKNNDLHILALNQPALLSTDIEIEEAKKETLKFAQSLNVFSMPFAKNKLLWLLLHLFNILSKWPYSSWRVGNFKMKNKIKSICTEVDFDIVHIDTAALLIYKNVIPSTIPIVLNHHNIESKLMQRKAQNSSNFFMSYYYLLQSKKLENLEKKYSKNLSLNICVSKQDKKDLLLLSPQANIEVVSNGTDVDFFSPSSQKPLNEIIFAGSMGWSPNEEGIIFFIKEVMPQIIKELPEVKFKIIGKGASRYLKELSKQNNHIELLGFVDDIRPYIATAKVYIVPLLVGGGTRLKILDAMAMGKAIVSTSIGAEGLHVEDQKDILLADSPEQMAKATLALLSSKKQRITLEKNARKKVEDFYAWNHITLTYELLLKTTKVPASL